MRLESWNSIAKGRFGLLALHQLITLNTQVARHIALPVAVRRALAESSPGHTRRLRFLHMDKLSSASVIVHELTRVRLCVRVLV